ncbi:28S ribosomal protein S35, mitochondrial-like [Mya arenaria]|uniref:28S ribosomal protein S35, mitochondrial-like n=1 Tax=Mya arenaria TaxID=6604 RepID=UPI0022E87766|nr:28S ribosomal protein S35, mitochondrial-like [Mya arenaria]
MAAPLCSCQTMMNLTKTATYRGQLRYISIRNSLLANANSKNQSRLSDQSSNKKKDRDSTSKRSSPPTFASGSDFRKFNLKKPGSKFDRKWVVWADALTSPPRAGHMPQDIDWTSVWPTQKTFNYSVVPLPIRQGMARGSEGTMKERGLPPGKYANTELVKIPNFLHLTPNHIKQQCAAMRKFCTPWPEELKSEASMKEHFHLEVISSDFCFAGPSVRDPRARVVTFKLNLNDLELDSHAFHKMKLLLGDKYDPKTGEITLTADRCPMKQQNYDYLRYVLTILYLESWKTEDWESEKEEGDYATYTWDRSVNKGNIVNLLNTYRERAQALPDGKGKQFSNLPEDLTADNITSLEEVKTYKDAVEDIFNVGENPETLEKYRQSVLKLLKIKPGQPSVKSSTSSSLS